MPRQRNQHTSSAVERLHRTGATHGRPLRIEITGAQTHDSKALGAFLGWNVPPLAIVADKAYGSNAIRQAIADEGSVAVIPSKSNARIPDPHHPNIYAMRNEVERFFCKMKDMRRLTTQHEKLKRTSYPCGTSSPSDAG
ncbi:MAG: transposase [Paracoccaceae bacterium]|nr:transposase [Paracoccaceae bacterium]MDG1371576.1 transposase [Paracoccaceae bacterium]